METEVHQVTPTANRRPKLTPDEIGHLIALFSVILGAFLYLYPAYLAGFPINDGGLFYNMLRAVQANGFRLPAYVQYNGLNIPFAYPPLGFYVGAALSTALHIDPILLLQWFPATVLILVSIAIYSLALRVLKSPIEAGIATFLYVCTPRSMTWLIMGGGLTRSLGQLFLVLTLASAYALYTERSRRRHLVLTALFASLVVLTHPGSSPAHSRPRRPVLDLQGPHQTEPAGFPRSAARRHRRDEHLVAAGLAALRHWPLHCGRAEPAG